MVSFTNHVLIGHQTMITGWYGYTQPIAFFGYFAFGALVGEIYLLRRDLKGGAWWWAVVLVSLVPFLVFRVSYPTALLTGWMGFTLMLSTLAIVTAAAFLPEPSGRLRDVAQWFGVLSYPVYLLHPLVHQFMLKFGLATPVSRAVLVVLSTIAISWAVSRYVEVPARNFGRRLARGRPAPLAA